MNIEPEKSFSFLKRLFFPLLCMLVLMNLSTLLLHSVGNSILYSQHSLQTATTLKRFSVFPYVFFVFSLSLFAIKFSIRSLFPKILNFFILSLIILISFSFYPENENNLLIIWWNHYFANQETPHIMGILKKWDVSLIYLATKMINPTVFSVLLWGIMNQATRFSEAIKYYIPLTILSQIICLPFTLNLASLQETYPNPLQQTQLFTFLACLGLAGILIIYYKMLKKLPFERWNLDRIDSVQLDQGSPIFSFGFLIASLGILTLFIDLYFKNQISNTLTSPKEYAVFMQTSSSAIGKGTLAISLLCLFLGPWLLKQKGWNFTILLSPVFIGVSFLLFLGSVNYSFFPLEFGMLCEIFLKGLKTNLFFPLIQIAYLSIPSNSRFKTKSWAELIIAPLLGFAGGSLIQLSLDLFGTMTAVSPFLASTSICIIGLIFIIASFIGSRKGLRNTGLVLHQQKADGFG
jgi:ATP/ADP translocase